MIFIVFIMKYIQKNKTADEWHFTPFIGVSRSSKLKTQSQKQISIIMNYELQKGPKRAQLE